MELMLGLNDLSRRRDGLNVLRSIYIHKTENICGFSKHVKLWSLLLANSSLEQYAGMVRIEGCLSSFTSDSS